MSIRSTATRVEREPEPPAGEIRVPGFVFRTIERSGEVRRRWDEGHRWDEAQFGDAPDSGFTSAPPDLRGPRRRRLAAVNRPVDLVQSDTDHSINPAGVQP